MTYHVPLIGSFEGRVTSRTAGCHWQLASDGAEVAQHTDLWHVIFLSMAYVRRVVLAVLACLSLLFVTVQLTSFHRPALTAARPGPTPETQTGSPPEARALPSKPLPREGRVALLVVLSGSLSPDTANQQLSWCKGLKIDTLHVLRSPSSPLPKLCYTPSSVVFHVWSDVHAAQWTRYRPTVPHLPRTFVSALNSTSSRVDTLDVVLPCFTEGVHWRDAASSTGSATAALQFASVGAAMEAVLGSGPSNQPARVRVHRCASQDWKHLQQAAHMPFLWPHEVECVASHVNGDDRVCRGTAGGSGSGSGSGVLMGAVADVSRPWVQYLVRRQHHRRDGGANDAAHAGIANEGFDALVRRVPWGEGWLSPRAVIRPLLRQAQSRTPSSRLRVAVVSTLFLNNSTRSIGNNLLCGTLSLGYSLRSQTRGHHVDLVAQVDERLLVAVGSTLTTAGWHVRPVTHVEPPAQFRSPELHRTFTKLQMLHVEGYDVAVPIDNDILFWRREVLSSLLDKASQFSGLLASPNDDVHMNTGIMAYPPSQQLRDLAVALAGKLHNYDGSDQVCSRRCYGVCVLFCASTSAGASVQSPWPPLPRHMYDRVPPTCAPVLVCLQGLLNEMFMHWGALTEAGCLFSKYRYAFDGDSDCWGDDVADCHQILHYVGTKKPWMCGFNNGMDCNTEQPSMCNHAMHRAWWASAFHLAYGPSYLNEHQRRQYASTCRVPWLVSSPPDSTPGWNPNPGKRFKWGKRQG